MKPRVSKPSTNRLGQIGGLSWTMIEMAGGWAETSSRLSKDEQAELVRLRKKGRNKRTPLTKAERAKVGALVLKAVGSDRIGDVLKKAARDKGPDPKEKADLDAAERLERAARLRDAGVITTEDYDTLKARYIDEL